MDSFVSVMRQWKRTADYPNVTDRKVERRPNACVVGRLCQTPIKRRRFTEWSRGDASDMDGQPARARERERTSQTPYNFGGLPTNISRASNRRDFIWDAPHRECC